MRGVLIFCFSLSALAGEMTLQDYQKKRVKFENSKGRWIEARCLKQKCLSQDLMNFKTPITKIDGTDVANIYCLEVLKGRAVSLKDEKKNNWGFCELKDGSYVDSTYLRSELVEY